MHDRASEARQISSELLEARSCWVRDGCTLRFFPPGRPPRACSTQTRASGDPNSGVARSHQRRACFSRGGPSRRLTENPPAQGRRGRNAPPARLQRSALTGLPTGAASAPSCLCPLLPLVFVAIVFLLDVVSRRAHYNVMHPPGFELAAEPACSVPSLQDVDWEIAHALPLDVAQLLRSLPQDWVRTAPAPLACDAACAAAGASLRKAEAKARGLMWSSHSRCPAGCTARCSTPWRGASPTGSSSCRSTPTRRARGPGASLPVYSAFCRRRCCSSSLLPCWVPGLSNPPPRAERLQRGRIRHDAAGAGLLHGEGGAPSTPVTEPTANHWRRQGQLQLSRPQTLLH